MASPYRRRDVLSVNRAYSHDPFESIETIGGLNPNHTRWKFSQAEAIAAIEAGTDKFFLTEVGQGVVEFSVFERKGQKYLTMIREEPLVASKTAIRPA